MSSSKTSNVNQNHIILGFFEFDLSPDFLTSELKLDPLDTGVKGDQKVLKNRKDILRFHDSNMWRYEWKILSNESIGDIIAKFIDEIIIPRRDIINRLTSKSKVQLRIVQYYYNRNNPG